MKVDAYIDGSFNAATGVYGAGVVLIIDGNESSPTCAAIYGNNAQLAKSRNVAGEVLAAVKAIALCIDAKVVESLTLHYDYAGIECWATGKWRANSTIAQIYLTYLQDLPFPLHFRKVAAHTGVPLNEKADALAKEACGLC